MNLKTKIMSAYWNRVIAKGDDKRIAAQTPTPGIQQFCDIPYLTDGNPMHLLDVYRPEHTADVLPVIIDVHGGGWMYGTKRINKNYCLELARRGFVVFNINYRLLPEVHFDGQLQDVFAAYRWIGQHCAEYGGDPEQICLTGDSAGGHIVTLSAVVNGNPGYESVFDLTKTGIEFRAVGATSPVINLTKGLMGQMLDIMLGSQPKQSKLYRFLNFENLYQGQRIPPLYIVTSKEDFVRKQSIELAEILEKHHGVYQFHDWSGEAEVKLDHVFSVLYPVQKESVETIDEMIAFFRRFLPPAQV